MREIQFSMVLVKNSYNMFLGKENYNFFWRHVSISLAISMLSFDIIKECIDIIYVKDKKFMLLLRVVREKTM